MVDDTKRPEDGSAGKSPEGAPDIAAPSADGAAVGPEAAPPVVLAAAGGETEPPASEKAGAAESDDAARAPDTTDTIPPSILGPRAAHTLAPSPPPRRRTPWGAMLVSGVIGGAVAAAAVGYAAYNYMPDDGSALNVLFARIGAVELAVSDVNNRPPTPAADLQAVKELVARVAKIEAANSGATDPEAIKSLTARVAKVEAALAAAASAGTAQSEPAVSSRPPEVGKAEFETLAGRVAALEKTTTSLQEAAARRPEPTSADRAVRLALVASGLRSAVDRGVPFAGELNAAKTLVPDPQALTPLAPFAASGVPSAAALGRELAALAPDLARAAGAPAEEGSYLDRLQARAERLVRVRPVSEAPGKDLAAVTSRIEARAKQADIAGALAELQSLPAAARAPAEQWIKKAEAREAAIAAARRVEAAALAAVGNP